MLLATFAQEAGSTLGNHQFTFRLARGVDLCFRKLELSGAVGGGEGGRADVAAVPFRNL